VFRIHRFVHRPENCVAACLLLLASGNVALADDGGYGNGYGTRTAQVAATGEMYVSLDGVFYAVDPNANPSIEYTQVDANDYAWVSTSAIMNQCQSTSSLGATNLFFIYGYTEPALPISNQAAYQFFLNAYGSAGIVFLHSIPGNVTCLYSVPPPGAYDVIFQNGFEL
jgi:hypothetical protein